MRSRVLRRFCIRIVSGICAPSPLPSYSAPLLLSFRVWSMALINLNRLSRPTSWSHCHVAVTTNPHLQSGEEGPERIRRSDSRQGNDLGFHFSHHTSLCIPKFPINLGGRNCSLLLKLENRDAMLVMQRLMNCDDCCLFVVGRFRHPK